MDKKKRPFISRNKLIALSVLVMLYCLLNLAGRIFIGPKHVPGTKGVEVYGIDEAGKRRIEQHLKEKYGEEFVCDKAYNNSNEFLFQRYKFGEHYEVHNKETGEEFHVFGFNYKGTKSGYEYRDGYFAVQNRERYEKYVQNVIQESFDGTCYVRIWLYDDVSVYNNQINKDTPIEDLFELTKDGDDIDASYHIWIPESEIRDAQELNQKQLEVARILKKHKLLGYVRAYVIIEGKEEEFAKYIAGKTDGKFSEFSSKKYRTKDGTLQEGVWWYDVERNKKDPDKIDIEEGKYGEITERIVE